MVASDSNHVSTLPLSKQQASTSPPVVKAGVGKQQRIVVSSPSGSIATLPVEQKDLTMAVALSLEIMEEGPVAGPSSVW